MQIILYYHREAQSSASVLADLISRQVQENYTLRGELPSTDFLAYQWQLTESYNEYQRLNILQKALPYVRDSGLALYLRGEGAKPIRRIVADLDGCLVSEELLIKLSEGEAFAQELSQATLASMQGTIPFVENFACRIAYLAGKQAKDLEGIAYTMDLAPGVDLLSYFIEGEDIRFDIASSNLVPYVHHLSLRLNAHEYIATMPSMDEQEVLDGKLVEPIVTGEVKRTFAISNPYDRYPAEVTLTIGDGANDLPMLSATGHALLYHSGLPHSLNIAHLVADLYFR